MHRSIIAIPLKKHTGAKVSIGRRRALRTPQEAAEAPRKPPGGSPEGPLKAFGGPPEAAPRARAAGGKRCDIGMHETRPEDRIKYALRRPF